MERAVFSSGRLRPLIWNRHRVGRRVRLVWTACPAWDVRQMAAYMLGMVDIAASIREGSRQRRAATVNGNIDIDRLTALPGGF